MLSKYKFDVLVSQGNFRGHFRFQKEDNTENYLYYYHKQIVYKGNFI
jgi:hypothetical protein